MGSKNRYDGINEYAVRVVTYRANNLVGKVGYTLDDLEDIEQELMLDLIERMEKYDPTRAKLTTFIDRVVNHKIYDLVQKKLIERKDIRRQTISLDKPVSRTDSDSLPLHELISSDDFNTQWGFEDRPSVDMQDLRIDIRQMLQKLTSRDRHLLSLLMQMTLTEAARELGLPRTTLQYHLQKLCAVLVELGWDESWRDGSSFSPGHPVGMK